MNDSSFIPKTFVFGADGFIGNHLLNYYRKYYSDSEGSSYKDNDNFYKVDLKDPIIEHLSLTEKGYKYAIIASGISSIKKCEELIGDTYSCNVSGVLRLVKQLNKLDIKVIWISSDYVFDGRNGMYTENSHPNPLNEYGRQKYIVEQEIPKLCGDNYLIIRLSKVYDTNINSNTFLTQIANSLLKGEQIKAAIDQVFSPIHIQDVVNSIVLLQMGTSYGLINVCSDYSWSRYDIATMIANNMRQNANLIMKVLLDDLQEKFLRPKNTSMKCTKLHNEIDIKFSSIERHIKFLADSFR